MGTASFPQVIHKVLQNIDRVSRPLPRERTLAKCLVHPLPRLINRQTTLTFGFNKHTFYCLQLAPVMWKMEDVNISALKGPWEFPVSVGKDTDYCQMARHVLVSCGV